MRISDWSSDVCSSDRIAEQNLNLYLAAVLEATLLPPPMPEADWRETMDRLSAEGVAAYRGVVREHPQFVDYFRQATPELELGRLPLGSRPSKRREGRSEEHTSELQSLMRTSYAVFGLQQKK